MKSMEYNNLQDDLEDSSDEPANTSKYHGDLNLSINHQKEMQSSVTLNQVPEVGPSVSKISEQKCERAWEIKAEDNRNQGVTT